MQGLKLIYVSKREPWQLNHEDKYRVYFVSCVIAVWQNYNILTLKWLEMHGCVISTAATAVLVLKHQSISSHGADKISIVSDQFYSKYHIWYGNIRKQNHNLKKYILFKG